MSMQETIALIERYYAAFNRGDWNAMLECLTDDVVHDLNQGPREKGRDTFRAFLGRMDHSYSEQLRDIVALSNADGSRAGAEYVVHGTYNAGNETLVFLAILAPAKFEGPALIDVHLEEPWRSLRTPMTFADAPA